MKYISAILIGFTLLASCIREQLEEGKGDPSAGMPVTLSLMSPAAIEMANDKLAYLDYQVNGLRIMGYDTNTGRLVFNTHVTPTSDGSNTPTSANKDIQWETQAQVVTGDFTIVLIANETVDSDLAAALNNDSKVAALADLEKLTVNRTALKWDGPIPMLAVFENVSIVGDNSVEIDGTPVASPWKVKLKHTCVRVDVTILLDKSQAELWEDAARINGGGSALYLLTVGNIPEKQYLFPGNDNSAFAREDHTYQGGWSSAGYPNLPGLIQQNPLTEEYAIKFPRLILPESYFTDEGNQAKALIISTDISPDGTTKTPISGIIGYNIDPAKGAINYTLPQNTYLSVEATMESTVEDLGIKIEVNDWESGYYEDVIPGSYFFSVDNWIPEYRENVHINASFMLDIKTTYPGGWTWEVHYEEEREYDWMVLLENWGVLQIDDWYLAHDVPTQYRTAYLHLKSGNMTKVIKFVQQSTSIK